MLRAGELRFGKIVGWNVKTATYPEEACGWLVVNRERDMGCTCHDAKCDPGGMWF